VAQAADALHRDQIAAEERVIDSVLLADLRAKSGLGGEDEGR
jgi:hypothetical protein